MSFADLVFGDGLTGIRIVGMSRILMPVDENQETYSVGMQTMRYAINIVVTYTSCPRCQIG